MSQLTIYIRSEDLDTYRAIKAYAAMAGVDISPLITKLLKQFLRKHPKCECGHIRLPRWKHCPQCGKEF